MFSKKLSLLVLLAVVLLSCSSPESVNSQSEQLPPTPSHSNLGQMLPITAKAIMGKEVIELEVAATPQQQTIGLMYRTSLPKNRGMLFPFSPARRAQFWMKNMSISLDMIFLTDGTIQAIFPHVPPCKVDPCPVYGPVTPINQVIELPAGRAEELGLKIGDHINLKFLDTPSTTENP